MEMDLNFLGAGPPSLKKVCNWLKMDKLNTKSLFSPLDPNIFQ